jgi:hypothetical protein
MLAKDAAVAAALGALLATLAPAQTASEKLETGIYTQTTVGAVDTAIRIYREVIASSGDRALAGQAQMQIVSALLQKRDFTGAAQEFKTLVTDYADQSALMASVTTRLGGGMRAAGSDSTPPPDLTRGTLQNGVYHLSSIGTEITLPPGWSVIRDHQAYKAENIFFRDQDSTFKVVMYLAPLTAADKAADVDATLRAMMDSLVKERVMEGLTDFELLPETVKPWLVQGRHALSAVAQFSHGGRTKMYEYFAYVCGKESYVFILGQAPAGQIPSYRDRVERLIAGTKVP